jgi:hypothetical protein
LKIFTDENYKAALSVGEKEVAAILKDLSSVKYPNFEAFKAAREKAETDLKAQLNDNVAYPELAERLLRGLETLSNKLGLEFNLTDQEKEKERILLAEHRKSVEQQKKRAEMEESLMATHQIQMNLEMEKRLLMEQNEKQAREWKARVDLESKLRTEQVARDLNAGFEERAKMLQKELAESNNQTLRMVMQMQKESKESQAKLTQALIEQNKIEQQKLAAESRSQQGLLGSVLSPVTNLVGNLLSPAGRIL